MGTDFYCTVGGRRFIDSTMPRIAKALEDLVEKLDKPKDTTTIIGVPEVVWAMLREAVQTDGAHHKQWYLEQIAEALKVELPGHEEGIAP